MGIKDTLSGSLHKREPAHLQAFEPLPPGQHCPTQCPPLERARRLPESPLGPPLSITEVATLIGCSPWTVRQRHIPKGLPYFRSGASGKLIFYTNQVVRWIETKQKGGQRP